MNNTLKFVIVGAPKSGTTSLFRWLAAHPDIYMPPEKELGFFSNKQFYERGPEWYLETYFRNARPTQIFGEATPTYLTYSSVSERIHHYFPDAIIIAILRNPIDRAYSHFRFNHAYLTDIGATVESDFESIAKRLIERGPVPDSEFEQVLGRHSEYLMDGQYGRLLTNVLRHIPANQLKVYFFDELSNNPLPLYKNLLTCLGADPTIVPESVGKAFNVTGNLRYPRLTSVVAGIGGAVAKSTLAKKTLDVLGLRVPLRAWWLRFMMGNYVKPKELAPIPDNVRQMLRDYFRDDVRLLEKILGRATPWDDDFKPSLSANYASSV